MAEVETTNPIEELKKMLMIEKPQTKRKRIAIELSEEVTEVIEEVTEALRISMNTLVHGVLFGVLAKYESGILTIDEIAALILEAKSKYNIKITPKRKRA